MIDFASFSNIMMDLENTIYRVSNVQNLRISIAIGVVVILGIVIIVNQIKIKKMLRKLTEEQDKPERMR